MTSKDITEKIKAYNLQFPNMPTRTLAQKFVTENPGCISLESCRGRLRYIRKEHRGSRFSSIYEKNAFSKSKKDNNVTLQDQWSSTYNEDSAVLQYKGSTSIQSKEEAIKHFKIDTKVWDVKKYEVNSWDVTMLVKVKDTHVPKKVTNYQVKLHLVPKIGFFDLEE